MMIFLIVGLLSFLGPVLTVGPDQSANLICFYNSNNHDAEGLAKYSLADLEVALQFCTHVIYGYAGISSDNFQIKSLNEKLDIRDRHFATVTALKDKNPHIKFLLSVGGDHDLENPEKYLNLLEAGRVKQNAFIESARDLLRRFDFDGLDLAFQLPRNKPRKVHTDLGMAWKGFKKLFTGDFVVDKQASEHREQFTDFVRDIKTAFEPNELLLSLTVLPNVNSSWYFDAPAIINYLDFVNLAAFDFLTPERNPEEADFTAPLYELHDQNRLDHYNVNFQVEYWMSQRVPARKINVGIPTYGRGWKMTKDSGITGLPVVTATDGPSMALSNKHIPGLYNWADVCQMLPNGNNVNGKGASAPLRRVSDPTKRYGVYAFRAADENGENGMFVSYEDPDTAANKAGYVKVKNLGGVALFDITNDDFRGRCTGDKYPMLRAIKYRLL